MFTLLKELLTLKEADDVKLPVPVDKAAKAVYHRDYVRTKHKKYRKYTPPEQIKKD